MEKYIKIKKGGYTIIETMIAVSIFVVVVMYGMGALVNANLLHNKSKDMRSIIDNLSFVMEDMARNIRTGSTYRCITSNSDYSYPNIGIPLSGQHCWGIAFEPALGNPLNQDQWFYFIGTYNGFFGIYKSVNVGGVQNIIQLSPNEVVIDQANNAFSILGAESPAINGDQQQPLVNIRLVGHILYKGVTTPFSLQTTVSQRAIDI